MAAAFFRREAVGIPSARTRGQATRVSTFQRRAPASSAAARAIAAGAPRGASLCAGVAACRLQMPTRRRAERERGRGVCACLGSGGATAAAGGGRTRLHAGGLFTCVGLVRSGSAAVGARSGAGRRPWLVLHSRKGLCTPPSKGRATARGMTRAIEKHKTKDCSWKNTVMNCRWKSDKPRVASGRIPAESSFEKHAARMRANARAGPARAGRRRALG